MKKDDDDGLTETALSKDLTTFSQDNKSISSFFLLGGDGNSCSSQVPPTVIASSSSSNSAQQVLPQGELHDMGTNNGIGSQNGAAADEKVVMKSRGGIPVGDADDGDKNNVDTE